MMYLSWCSNCSIEVDDERWFSMNKKDIECTSCGVKSKIVEDKYDEHSIYFERCNNGSGKKGKD